MAWPVYLGEDNSPEPAEENVGSITDNLGETPIYGRGAAGIHNLRNTRNLRVPNRDVDRIRGVRRYSLGDTPRGIDRLSGNFENDVGQRHSIPQFGNGRRYSLEERTLSNVQQASGSNTINITQRHSYPCCHINPNMVHSCCLDLKRRLSLESLNLHRRHSLPQNYFHDPFNRDVSFGYASSCTEYERQRSFSVSHSLLFGNENFQADRYLQQAVCDARPQLFLQLLSDQLEQRGLQLPEDISWHMGQSGEMPQSFIYLIDRFSASVERVMIFCLAQRVQFPLCLSSFVAVLDGINNVVVPPKKSYKIAATACLVGIIAVLFLMKRN